MQRSVADSIAVQIEYNKGGPKCRSHPLEDCAYVCTDPTCPDHVKLLQYCTMCLMEAKVHRNHPHKTRKEVNEEVMEMHTALKNNVDALKNGADKMYTELGPLIRYLEDMQPPKG